jgi:hypothetical protein
MGVIKMRKLWTGMAAAVLLCGTIGTAQAALTLDEGFTTVLPAGWAKTNNSAPLGSTDWFQGETAVFAAQAGPANSYAAANFNAAANGGNVSDWLFTPTVALHDGDVFSFFTRTEANSAFPDSLEVRVSTSGSSTDVGATATSLGVFTTLLRAINPTQSVGGYPETWTQFSNVLSGVGANTQGRIAFRYLVTDTSNNGNYIGIDTVQLSTRSVTTVPEPSTVAALALGLALLGWHLRRANAR